MKGQVGSKSKGDAKSRDGRKQVKAGKGGKVQLDGSKHHESLTGDEEFPAALDKNDPNYDQGEPDVAPAPAAAAADPPTPPKADGEHTQSIEQKTQWLRDRGVEIETVEERREKEAMKEHLDNREVDPSSGFTYVRIPALSTTALSVVTAPLVPRGGGDRLPDMLKNSFADGKEADTKLVTKQLETLKTTNTGLNQKMDLNNIDANSVKSVMAEGSTETFPLVRAAPSNKHLSVNIYLDEAGMLKKLPLNVRATELARSCGYSPPPTFYGDVAVGRVSSIPMLRNVSFGISDMDAQSEWIKKAIGENMERQHMVNAATGRNDVQAGNDGEDGVEKDEEGYKWTQTDEEVEIVLNIGTLNKKEIKAKFLNQSVKVNDVFCLELFARIDPDGCTWTLEKSDTAGEHNLVITCEKCEEASWPRIEK